LLSDIRVFIGEHEFIRSTDLVTNLNAMEDRDWDTCEFNGKPLTAKSLKKRLKRFKIEPVQERVKGYDDPIRIYKKDKKMLNVFERYLKNAPVFTGTDGTSGTPVTKDGGVSTSLSMPSSTPSFMVEGDEELVATFVTYNNRNPLYEEYQDERRRNGFSFVDKEGNTKVEVWH
jgi:Protein of unknown function (DUF3631)